MYGVVRHLRNFFIVETHPSFEWMALAPDLDLIAAHYYGPTGQLVASDNAIIPLNIPHSTAKKFTVSVYGGVTEIRPEKVYGLKGCAFKRGLLEFTLGHETVNPSAVSVRGIGGVTFPEHRPLTFDPFKAGFGQAYLQERCASHTGRPELRSSVLPVHNLSTIQIDTHQGGTGDVATVKLGIA